MPSSHILPSHARFNKSKQKRIIFKQCSEAREISTMWISEL